MVGKRIARLTILAAVILQVFVAADGVAPGNGLLDPTAQAPPTSNEVAPAKSGKGASASRSNNSKGKGKGKGKGKKAVGAPANGGVIVPSSPQQPGTPQQEPGTLPQPTATPTATGANNETVPTPPPTTPDVTGTNTTIPVNGTAPGNSTLPVNGTTPITNATTPATPTKNSPKNQNNEHASTKTAIAVVTGSRMPSLNDVYGNDTSSAWSVVVANGKDLGYLKGVMTALSAVVVGTILMA